MTIRRNLSSRPFRNRALPWTVTTIVTVASIVALIFIARSTIQTNAQAQTTQNDVAELRKRIEVMNRQAEAVRRALTPEQERTLKSTRSLVDRKRFSWTRLFADLESVLPGNVRVARIVVKEVSMKDDRTVAYLDLTVVSKNSAIVTQMIDEMQREGIFQAELMSQNLQRGREETGSEYEMNVRYTPRMGMPIEEGNRRPVDTATDNRSRPQ
jgi:hypothetical protein